MTESDGISFGMGSKCLNKQHILMCRVSSNISEEALVQDEHYTLAAMVSQLLLQVLILHNPPIDKILEKLIFLTLRSNTNTA
jgi:hypothetical protein